MPVTFTTSAQPLAPDAQTLTPGTAAQVANQARSLRHRTGREGHPAPITLAVRPVLTVSSGTDLPAEGGATLTLLQRLGLVPRRALVRPGRDAVSVTGTLDQVAAALLAYYDIGVDHIAFHGDDPLEAALIALVRRRVERRDAVLSVLAG